VGENVRTISYMPGSNFANVSDSPRRGAVQDSEKKVTDALTQKKRKFLIFISFYFW
jgi:hypothetical protein